MAPADNDKAAAEEASACASMPALLAHMQTSVGEGLGFLMRLNNNEPHNNNSKERHHQHHQHHQHPGSGRRHERGSNNNKQQQQHKNQHPHNQHPQQQQQRRPATAVVQPLGAAAVGALSAYCGLRSALKAYQALRRRCLRRLLCVVGPALAACGTDYYVDFGSLLGAVREGDVIAYDNDADVVAINPDWDALLVKLRAALPPAYKVYFVVPSEDASIRWLRVLYGVGVLDVYGGYYNNDNDAAAAVGGASGNAAKAGAAGAASANNKAGGGGDIAIPQGHGDLCDVPAALVLPLRPLEFRGVTLSGPADAHGVLVHRYGRDYMVPRYMDKGRDAVEQEKLYARALTLLAKIGVRI
jgi:hypothetical protein